MAATTIPDYPRGITFEQVWAALMEDREQLKELREYQKETAKLVSENSEQLRKTEALVNETTEQMKKTEALVNETTEQMKKTDERMGFITNRFGELAEHLVAPSIHTRFNELGYSFSGASPGGYKIFNNKGETIAEIDILLENGSTIMAVEVKAKPVTIDIEKHIKRLEILRASRLKNNDTRKIQGAIAGAIFGTSEKKATIEAGLYVIEQSGDTMKIIVPEGFVPRVW